MVRRRVKEREKGQRKGEESKEREKYILVTHLGWLRISVQQLMHFAKR